MGRIRAGLRGALLLAQGRPEGLIWFGNRRRDATTSFWSALICVPFFVLLRLADWRVSPPSRVTHALLVEALVYVIGWAGFALLSRSMSRAIGRLSGWPRFLAAWNWCNVVQYALLGAAAIPDFLGEPMWVREATGIFTLLWTLWLEWYATRLTLAISGVQAVSFVALDMFLGILLTGVAATFS